MSRFATFLYGIAAYAIFFVTFLYAVGFVGNLVVPKSIDSGSAGPLVPALLVNTVLLLTFAVQHSGMARPGFKAWLTRFLSKPLERSTYVLLSSAALILLYGFWRPMPGTIWSADAPLVRGLLWGVFALGWLTVLISTFMIGHFELFGLRQVWMNLRGSLRPDGGFRTPWLYRVVRHPIMLGFFLAFWSTPDMSAGHLLFALATTGYIVIAVFALEERDLIELFGDRYREYRRTVPAFIPVPGRSWRADAPSATAPKAEAFSERALGSAPERSGPPRAATLPPRAGPREVPTPSPTPSRIGSGCRATPETSSTPGPPP
jgi:protein-S-isoprenylcysteine O-methyltransferase Ste14